jgi:hypothetical protein
MVNSGVPVPLGCGEGMLYGAIEVPRFSVKLLLLMNIK